MTKKNNRPRILFLTPEVAYLPRGMGNMSDYVSAKGGGVADVSAVLVRALFEQGVDVHVALPDFRKIFHRRLSPLMEGDFTKIQNRIPEERVHFAKDRCFFYVDQISYGGGLKNTKLALAFQREIINNIIPRVQPDLIHCNDWMTGLIPAQAKRMDIPCLYTIHNIYSTKCPLAYMEDMGIDTAFFWRNLFFEYFPLSYEESREANQVDFLTSGVFGANFVNTVSPSFLTEMIRGQYNWVNMHLKIELANKLNAGCAVSILNAPDPSFDPMTDKALFRRFSANDHYSGKQYNKLFLQEKLGLIMDSRAPVFFWPSRLDGFQKGCQLLAEILTDLIFSYRDRNLEIIFVADGEFNRHFKHIVKSHILENRVAVCDFEEQLARLAYGAADFVLMPSRFEPGGLPQMIGPLYGALPVAHDTGGIHDTVVPLNMEAGTGNGFLFKTFDAKGLLWAIEQALAFYDFDPNVKAGQIERIMTQSAAQFNYRTTARQYIDIYESMVQRPLIN